MDDSGPAGFILFLLLLIVDAFFYGFGAASVNLNNKEIERRAEEEKDKKTIRLVKIVNEPAVYINTVQLVVTVVNLVMGAFYVHRWKTGIGQLLENILKNQLKFPYVSVEVISIAAMLITFCVMIYIVLTFGILLPKRIAVRNPEKWSYKCINAVYMVTKVLTPITGLVTMTTDGIQYLFGIRNRVDETDVTEEEIINMLQEGHEQGVIQASEAEMISNIFELGDKEAQDIMTHRKNIIAIDSSELLQDAISFMLQEKNSRYPVYEENIDHIIGILHLKDALRFHSKNGEVNAPLADLPGLLREPGFVPQTKNINELFQEMQSKKIQMVIVVDEYGQTDGLLAMEDILEELVGEIWDEHDEIEVEFQEEKDGCWRIVGSAPLEEMEERFGLGQDADASTVGGWVMELAERIPEVGEEFHCGSWDVKVVKADDRHVQEIMLVPHVMDEDDEDEGFDENKIFVAYNINEALTHVYALSSGGKKKVILLENDLPDNYSEA